MKFLRISLFYKFAKISPHSSLSYIFIVLFRLLIFRILIKGRFDVVMHWLNHFECGSISQKMQKNFLYGFWGLNHNYWWMKVIRCNFHDLKKRPLQREHGKTALTFLESKHSQWVASLSLDYGELFRYGNGSICSVHAIKIHQSLSYQRSFFWSRCGWICDWDRSCRRIAVANEAKLSNPDEFQVPFR